MVNSSHCDDHCHGLHFFPFLLAVRGHGLATAEITRKALQTTDEIWPLCHPELGAEATEAAVRADRLARRAA